MRPQPRRARHPETAEELDEIDQRIETLWLHAHDAARRVTLRPLLEEAVGASRAFYDAGRRGVTPKVGVGDHDVEDCDAAIPAGLLINEFVTYDS